MTVHRFIIVLFSFCAVGCFAPISVEKVRPPTPVAVANDQAVLSNAGRLDEKHPLQSAGKILDALRVAADQITAGNHSAIPEYNFLAARLVDQLMVLKIRPWQQQIEIPSQTTSYLVRGTHPTDFNTLDSNQSRLFVPTDRLVFRGKFAINPAVKNGIGAPLVAFLPVEEGDRDHHRNDVRYRNITALITFTGNRATVSLIDPHQTETVPFGNRMLPLRADFGANVSLALSKERIDKLGLARLLKPGDYDDTAWLGRLQPEDVSRTPVLFIHGLQDTPASFAPMYIHLMDDPLIRKHYQFWAFSYPSGYPYPYSAANLRRELEKFHQRYPGNDEMVVIGHSMGGLIARALVTDSGDKIWRHLFGTAPADTPVTGKSRKLLEDSIIFESDPNIKRVVFLSTPHQGSELAGNWIGRLSTKLVRLPNTIANLKNAISDAAANDQAAIFLNRTPNSIDTLNPKSPFLKSINRIPIREDVACHSIIGDKGKDDSPDSSDGIVEYWSSHLQGAESERIVPTDHGTQLHLESFEEVRRILYLHAGANYTPEPVSKGPETSRHLRGPVHR